jgi:hypothetical protein
MAIKKIIKITKNHQMPILKLSGHTGNKQTRIIADIISIKYKLDFPPVLFIFTK